MLTRWLVVYVLTFLLSLVRCSKFQLPSIGACPDLKAQQKFMTNIEKFVDGKWFVQSSFDTEALQGRGRCMTASYRYNPFNQNIWVSTGQFNIDTNWWERLDGEAIPQDVSKDEAKFTLKFTVPIFGKVSGKYTVLSTDYETYAVMHGCGSFLDVVHYDCCWLMSKKQVLTAKEEEQFYNTTTSVLSSYEILDPTKFIKVDQKDCGT